MSKRRSSDFKIGYPVAIDNDYRSGAPSRTATGRPLPDRCQGPDPLPPFRRRQLCRTEQAIQDLLREAGRRWRQRLRRSARCERAEASPDLKNIRSGETYLGIQRRPASSNEGLRADTPAYYSIARPASMNGVSPAAGPSARKRRPSTKAGRRITYRFSARDLHLVFGPRRRQAGPLPGDDRRQGARDGPWRRYRCRRQRHGDHPRSSTSSSASPAASRPQPSRSASSIPACRPTPSPSAEPLSFPHLCRQ
jgi:hypothetical protein